MTAAARPTAEQREAAREWLDSSSRSWAAMEEDLAALLAARESAAWTAGAEAMRRIAVRAVDGTNTNVAPSYSALRDGKRIAAYDVAHELERHWIKEIESAALPAPPAARGEGER